MQQTAFGADTRQKRITLISIAFLTLVWLAIYASTVSPSVNFIDSGELVTALHEPGIAHPPGYPLYTLMGYVVSNALPGEVAWRVNIFSAFWGALAVGAFATLLIVLNNYLRWSGNRASRNDSVKRTRSSYAVAPPKRKQKESRESAKVEPAQVPPPTEVTGRHFLGVSAMYWLWLGAALSAASLLGASATFWSRTAQAKMYTLHYFFVATLFLLALLARWAYERKDETRFRRWLLALNVALGLSLSNHLMTVLLVPGLLLMLLVGSDVVTRVKALIQKWAFGIPAVLLPVLLYAYLPLRASQQPLMDWGSPDTFGDFWRHITGWQYGAYLVGTPFSRLWGFISDQWAWLSTPVLLVSLFAGGLLARANLAVFISTLATVLTTVFFCLAYGISEIEPYLVPLYMMLLVWLGTAGYSIPNILQEDEPRGKAQPQPAKRYDSPVIASAIAGILFLLAVVSASAQYPGQNHSSDRLAGQFAENALGELPQNSVLLTDYWDFYSPTIYLQNVLNQRRDIAIVDISLLKYPWYTGYLAKNSPTLLEKSKDLLPTFQTEQRKWVNGQTYDVNVLTNSYFGLIDSFIDRNLATRPTYVLFQNCDAGKTCDSQRVAQNYNRQKVGLASRLVPKLGASPSITPVPLNYKLDGIITGNPVPMDDFARINTCLYAGAFISQSQAYTGAKEADKAKAALDMAGKIVAATPGHCNATP